MTVTAVLTMLAGLAIACIEVRTQPQLPPEPVPEQIEGARWPSLPVEYCIAVADGGFVDPETFVASVEEAFRRWGLPAERRVGCPAEIERGNRVNQIGWGTLPERAEGGVHEAGLAELLYAGCRGPCPGGANAQIIEANIRINPDPPSRFRSSSCLFTTILHEVGHFWGLHHLDQPAIMAAAHATCPQELTAADIQAINELYGPAIAVPADR
jgi:hypothetical protein